MPTSSACVRFAETCRDDPLALVKVENEIAFKSKDIPKCTECTQDIYLGVFFDGTNNNKFRDTDSFGHSNVARLYEAFIGTPAKQRVPSIAPKIVGWDAQGKPRTQPRNVFPDVAFRPAGFPDSEFKYYRKIYIPGVGTPFPEVGDPGTGIDKTLGLAMAKYGQARLDWAMLQVCNQLHAAVTGQPLRDSFALEVTQWPKRPEDLASFLSDLDAQLSRELDVLENELAKAVIRRGQNKPTIRRVRLSIFGFSRGAAKARAFANLVIQRWGGRIGGLKLKLDFLGIFDTVASVGPAQSVPGADGHFAWANGDAMVVPPQLRRCVHLVSAHEVRASFPLDSICQGGALPANAKEIVYPGVHSDVGGGYPPNDQGRSLGAGAAGDCRKLSQVPLAQMYREARMAGVPLATQAQMFDNQVRNFKLDPQLRADFNAYVEATRTGRIPPTNGRGDPAYAEMFPTEEQPRHPLEALVFTHYSYFLQWRKQVLEHAHELPGMTSNPNATKHQDIEDIRGANEELQKEIRFLESPDPKKFDDVDDPTIELVLNASKLSPSPLPVAKVLAVRDIKASIVSAMQEKQRQWDYSLKDVWHGKPLLNGKAAADVNKLFECYAHDSRAWFKALLTRYKLNADSRIALVQSLLRMGNYRPAPDDEDWFTSGDRAKEQHSQIAELETTLEQQKAAGDWLGQSRTEAQLAALRQHGPLIRGGREPYRMYGYIRHRRIYQTGQLDEAANAQRQKSIAKGENERIREELIRAENTKHEEIMSKFRREDHRVRKEGRPNYDEYRLSTELLMSDEYNRHASRLEEIRRQH